MGIDYKYIISIFEVSIPYLKDTIMIALLGFVLAIIVSILLAIVNENKTKILYPFSKLYVSFFRCTPIMSQLFFFYYGFAQVSETIRTMQPVIALILIIGLNYASFMSETIRGAFLSVAKSQKDAGLACGMTSFQIAKRIILPQAIRTALPGLMNSFIGILKSTSLGFTVGAIEFMTRAKIEATNNVRFFEGYFVILIVYWVVIAFFVYLQKKLETKLNDMY